MNILDQPPDPPRSRRTVVIAGGALLLVLVAVAAWWLVPGRPEPEPAAPTAAERTEPPPIVPPLTDEAASAPAAPAPAAAPRTRKPKTPAAPPPAEPAAPALTLKVTSDVPGADVFVDRQYVGKTPLETHEVTPGSHVLNVSAEGYESQALPIEVAAGANEVAVRFKVVRLNEAVAVVHKHGIGSCEGRLVADTQGLRYETPNKDHAFSIPFAQVRSFEVDYLQKNLRLTRRDGKTFNFTDRNANADALFVFHKKVEAARTKLKDVGSQ